MRGDGKIFLRNRIWWLRYWRHGQELRESTKSTDEHVAKRILKERLDELGAERRGLERFITPSAKKVRVADLLFALKADFRQRHKDSSKNLSGLKLAVNSFGHIRAYDLTPGHINAFIDRMLDEGYQPATINRITGAVGQAFKLAMREGGITRAPYIKRLSEKGNERQGFTDAATFQRIYDNLPINLRDFAQFAFSTGWRKGEIASLDWSNVQDNDGMIRLRPDQTKNGRGRSVPVTGKLVGVIKRRREARVVKVDGTSTVSRWIFHRRGEQILEFRKSWATACEKAGKPGLLFHDLRRSAVTAMVQAGVPQLVAMAISGHETASMFKRYNIGVESELVQAMTATEQWHEAQMAKQPAQTVHRMTK